MSRFFVEKICLTVTKKFVGNACVLCFRKFPVAKGFMDKKGGGGSIKVLRGNFVVSQFQKTSLVNRLVCH